MPKIGNQTAAENCIAVGGVRFAHLDGMRGIAALYVAAFHCYQMQLFVSSEVDSSRSAFFRIFKPLCMGHYAVAVFIVLSGYCLMLPIATNGSAYLMKDGFSAYFARRARRIIPPFYAAVLLTIVLLPISRSVWRMVSESGAPNLQSLLGDSGVSGVISQSLSHLFLLNNGVPINDEALVKFPNNTPLWSVATESQIYILFPTLLLPILRRFGPSVLIASGIGIGAILSFAFGGRYQLACPWMLGVFSIGVLGALLTCSREKIYCRLREWIPWGYLGAVILAGFLIVGATNLGLFRRHPVIVDTSLGVGIMCCLIALSLQNNEQRAPVVQICAVFLSSKYCRRLGDFSYSLYLVHYPLLVLLQGIVVYFCRSLAVADYVMLFPVMALVIGCASVFAFVFENPLRHFTKREV